MTLKSARVQAKAARRSVAVRAQAQRQTPVKLVPATPEQSNFLKYIDESKQGDQSFRRGGERFTYAEGGRTPAEQKARLQRAVKDFNALEPYVKKGYWLEVQTGMRRKGGYIRYDLETLPGKEPTELNAKFEELDLACRAKDFDAAATAYEAAKSSLEAAVKGAGA